MLLGHDERFFQDKGGYNTAREINQQPDVWLKLFETLKGEKQNICDFLTPLFSNKHIRIILTGAGTSAFVGYSSAGYLRRALGLNIEAIDTTDIVSAPKDYLFKDRETLIISHARSGDSPESVATIKLAKELIDNVHFLNITCNPSGQLFKEAAHEENSLNILMPEATNDLGFAMTSSFTSMLLAEIMLPHIKDIERWESLFAKLSQEAKRILSEDVSAIQEIANNDYNRLVYLGSGCLKGCATEAALKTLELTHGVVNTNSNSFLGFRHGPKSVINDSTLLGFFVSTDPYTQRYEMDLINEVIADGGERKLVGFFPYNKTLSGLDYAFCLKNDFSDVDAAFLTPVYIIYAQLLGIFKSLQLGITPDNPNPEGHVNRVVKGVRIYDL
ncbi:SIS domain-containing protein [Coprothermobacter platensis]|uniref:SIS domain-containing protein n=1 Tax=Coprothermobacter platensis TaxID=108819 RepID=UPI000374E7EA|nr:SIS domain-containing protein [Coprothermobacter platensis]